MVALGATSLASMTSCTDSLDPQPLQYKEDPNFAPPHIKAEWKLEEIGSDLANDYVYAYKDKLYNDLFTRTLGWNGGDGVLTVGLPGGNILWTFNDSFYGTVNGETRARINGKNSFPRNSIMVQDNEIGTPADDNLHWMADWIQTDKPEDYGYYMARTHVDHPQATNYNGDGIAQDYLYWSGDGTIVDGKLQLIWMGVHTPGNGDMLNQNAALAIYSLDGKPGDPGYMKMESIDHNWIPANPYGYGSTLMECNDGHLYLYSSTGTGGWLENVPVVARTKGADLTSGVEYYVPNDDGEMAWQDGYPSLLQVQNAGISGDFKSITMPWVFEKDGMYYMLAQSYPFGRELNIFRSENPWGPFTDKQELLKFPCPLDDLQGDKFGVKYQNLYMLNYHPALSRDGELVISTNTDAGGTDDNGNVISELGSFGGFARNFSYDGSADWYRPFFYRIYKWEKVWN